MFADMIIFMILAYRYKSIPQHKEEPEEVQAITEPEEKAPKGLDNVAFKDD